MKRLCLALLMVLLLVGIQAHGDDQELPLIVVRCTWNPPVPGSGSTPVRYKIEIKKTHFPNEEAITRFCDHQGGPTDTQEYFFDGVIGGTLYQMRVQGIDEQGRPGLWSEWSEPEDWNHPVQ